MKLQPAAPQNAARPPPSWVLLLRGERRAKLTAGRAAPLHAASAAASCSTHTHGMEQQHGQEGRRFRMPQDSPFPRIVLCCFVVFGGCLITFYSPPSLARPTEHNRTTAGRGGTREQSKTTRSQLTSQRDTERRASPRNWPKESLFRATTAPVTTCRPWERGQENPKAAAALSNPEAEPNPRCARSRRWPPTAGFWVSGGARRAPSPRGAPQTRGLGAQRGAALRPRCHPSCACRRRARRRRSLGKEHRGYGLISTLRTGLRGPTAISVSH